MIEKEVEARLVESGATAPRLSPDHIDAQIIKEYYVNAAEAVSSNGPFDEALQCMTICFLVLRNGFIVMGTSACASPENFNVQIGRNLAYENARSKIWDLEGYALKTRMLGDSGSY